MASEDVVVKFGGSIGNLTESVDKARETIEGLAAPFTGLQAAFGGIGEAFAAAFAFDKVKEFAESMASLGTATTRASEILGVSTEQVAGLDLIAKSTGGNLEELQVAFGRLSKNIIDESDPAKRALAALGLSFENIRNKTPQAQLELLATKFAGIENGAEKDAIAIALLGRAGENLIPLLNQGAAGIQHWFEQSQQLEPALARNVEGMEEMHRAFVEMDAAIQGLNIEIFEQFKGVLVGVVQIVKDLAVSFSDAMEKGGFVKDIMEVISTTARGLVASIALLTAAFKEMWSAGVLAVQSIAGALTLLNNAIKDAATLNFGKIKEDFSAFTQGFEQDHAAYGAAINDANEKLISEWQSIFGAGDKKIEEEHAKSIARMAAAGSGGGAKTNNDAVSLAEKQTEGEIKALQEGLALKKQIWAGEVEAGKLSKDHEIANTIAETNKEYAAELALLQKEKTIGDLKASQVQEINNKIEQLTAKHNLEIVKLNQQAAQQSRQEWQQFFDGINGKMNSTIVGLLSGTENFRSLFKSALTDLSTSFLQTTEKMVEDWLLKTGIMAAATAALNALTGGLGGLATGAAGALHIPGFAVGSWELPGDMVAQVHQGEMIVPAAATPWAQSVLSGQAPGPGGGQGGGHTFNTYYSAERGTPLDTIRQHGREITKIISGHMNANPSLRPSY